MSEPDTTADAIRDLLQYVLDSAPDTIDPDLEIESRLNAIAAHAGRLEADRDQWRQTTRDLAHAIREMTAERDALQQRVERLRAYSEELSWLCNTEVAKRLHLQPSDLGDDRLVTQVGGRQLHACRMHHRVSIRDVAQYLGVSVVSVSAYENGDPIATTREDAMTDAMALTAQRWISDLGDETGD